MDINSIRQAMCLFSPKKTTIIAACVCAGLAGCDDSADSGRGGRGGDEVAEAQLPPDSERDDGTADDRPAVEEPEWEDSEPGSAPPEEAEPTSPGAPGLVDQPIQTGPLGGARPAPVTLPDDYDPSVSWPLVMLLHGYSVNGFLQDYYLGVGERVDSRGFILILPEGTVDSSGSQFWNAVPGCCNWDGSAVDDAGYLIGLLDEAMVRYNVDTSRVALIGHSNGGYMSHRLACDRSGLITAIASIAGTSYATMDVQCAAERPVSVLQIHGTFDTTVSYFTPFAGVGAEETVAWWRARNGCLAPASAIVKDYDTALLGDETEVTLAVECEAETAVGLWKMNGTGHIPIFTDDFTDDVLDFVLGSPRAAL
jgi:polyhydroxybutyrate depolymerase